nr:hypothetical protein [Tanacetum cinerariifolium]
MTLSSTLKASGNSLIWRCGPLVVVVVIVVGVSSSASTISGYMASPLAVGAFGTTCPRFIGPFEILDRVGEVSYRLALPPQLSHVHNVFHVSFLRGVMRKKTIPYVKILWRNHPSGKPLGKPRSLSELLILISFHDL